MSSTIFYVYADDYPNIWIQTTTTDYMMAQTYAANNHLVMQVTTYNITATTYIINYYNDNILISSISPQSVPGTKQQIYRAILSAEGFAPDTEGSYNNLTLGDTYTYFNATFTLQTYSLTGYALKWNTTTNLTGTDYNLSASYTTNSSVNFYLKKTGINYLVSYVKNGGTTSSDPTLATYNTPFTLPSILKTSYTFNGWYTTSTFSGTQYTTTPFIWTLPANTTFYAKFTINNFTLTYNPNGKGTGKAISVTAATTTLLPTLKAVGYTFVGWYNNQATTTPSTPLISPYTMPSENTTLYAKWTDNTQIKMSYLLDTYGNIDTLNSRTSISEYQNILGIPVSAKTSFNTNLKGKGPAPP